MKEIGITGGIGSGKSTVAKIFETFGYLVYYADQRAKDLYLEDQDMKEQVISAFGPAVYTADGQLDRKRLASIVFKDRSQLEILNGIVHPATRRDFQAWLQRIAASGYNKSFVLKEAAILYESGSDQGLDGVLTVYASKNTRLSRVLKRDGAVQDEVLARMDKQFPEQFKLFKADFSIYNDGHHHLIPQVKQAVDFFSHGSI